MILLAGFSTTATAQSHEMQINLGYSYALPMGSFKDQLSKGSGRGFQASILYGITDKIYVGFGTGFQDFYQKNPRQIYKSQDGSDISAVLTHSIQTIPLMAQGKYLFNETGIIQPYAALGIGGNFVMFNELLGEFGDTKTKFGFAARPEAGIHIPFRKNGETGINIGAAYNIMPYKNSNFSNLNNLALSAGIKFLLRR